MSTLTLFFLVVFTAFFFTSCKKEVGCTDPLAVNYDSSSEENCCCVFESDIDREIRKQSVIIHFEHMVNSKALELNTTNKPYSNALNQYYSVNTLRYLISDIRFHQVSGEIFEIQDYHLVDLEDSSTLIFQPEVKVPEGNYSHISFTFGFEAEDNIAGNYPDLNSKGWAWPLMMGGGYHYMQLEGFYDSAGVSKSFLTHMGPAQDKSYTPFIVENNHFVVHLDSSSLILNKDMELVFQMNIDQWYTNPYNWDFNLYNVDIMGNYSAQRKLNINGPSVFTFRK